MKADLEVTVGLARALLREQHPDLAALPLRLVAHGWDNVMVRAGGDLVLRLPRRAVAAPLVEHERAALPLLAPALATAVPGVVVPVPVRAGVPSAALGYPWSWSVTRWADGVAAAGTPTARRTAWAPQLGRFFATLHQPVPAGVVAPPNPFRGVPLADRAEATSGDALRKRLRVIGAALPAGPEARGGLDAARRVWEEALAAAPYDDEPLWLHGDPHPSNLVVRPGSHPDDPDRLAAVVDFGDVTSGDPASDLGTLWLTFDRLGRAACRKAMAAAGRAWDEPTWTRARGWALLYAATLLAHAEDHPAYVPVGRHALAALLEGRDGAGALDRAGPPRLARRAPGLDAG